MLSPIKIIIKDVIAIIISSPTHPNLGLEVRK